MARPVQIGKRTLLVALSVPYVLFLIPLAALSPITWIFTGTDLVGQTEWWLDQGERFQAWVAGDKEWRWRQS